jgi:uncharacterized protein YjbI with pentapeptide repeats
MEGVGLRNATLDRCRLTNAVLEGADLTFASFIEVDVREAMLTSARLLQAEDWERMEPIVANPLVQGP